MHIRAILAAALIVSLLAACTNQSSEQEAAPSTPVEQQTTTDSHAAEAAPSAPVLPPFTLQNARGEAVNLQSFKGRKVFVNLWATWCPPCRKEMPSIEKLAGSVDSNKVAFVMLSLDDDFNKALRYVQKQKISLPVYYPGENLPGLFNVPGIPVTFIFDERGQLIRRVEGGEEYNTKQYRQLLQ